MNPKPSTEQIQLEHRGNIGIFTIRHDIDLYNANELAERLHHPFDENVTAMIIDVSDVRFVDSSGLRVLFDFAAELQYACRKLMLVVPANAPLRRLLELSGAADLVTFQETVDDALANVN